MEDLWPEDLKDITPDFTAPVAILREQSSFLGNKMKNLIKVNIESGIRAQKFSYDFCIATSSIGYYKYRVFTLSHGIDAYPCTLSLDEDIANEMQVGTTIQVNSEEDLIGTLRRIFASQKIKKVITGLLAYMGQEDML